MNGILPSMKHLRSYSSEYWNNIIVKYIYKSPDNHDEFLQTNENDMTLIHLSPRVYYAINGYLISTTGYRKSKRRVGAINGIADR